MKILFIGDIIGKAGRNLIQKLLPEIVSDFQIDFCIANAENAAGGFGLTSKIVRQLFQENVDVLTSGNHIWDNKDILNIISTEKRLLRPANYPKAPGFSSMVYKTKSGEKVGILNLLGRIYMPALDCPFQIAETKVPGSYFRKNCYGLVSGRRSQCSNWHAYSRTNGR